MNSTNSTQYIESVKLYRKVNVDGWTDGQMVGHGERRVGEGTETQKGRDRGRTSAASGEPRTLFAAAGREAENSRWAGGFPFPIPLLLLYL